MQSEDQAAELAAGAEAVGTQEETTITDDELNRMIEELCNSKADEFRMLGYEEVDGRDIWDCVSDRYIKTGMPGLHQIVNDILSLKVTQFMNWMTMKMYRGELLP